MLDITKNSRLYFLDNLRTFMIFLVVVLHAGVVYETSGIAGLFWIVYDFDTNILADELNVIFDIFIMSIIFFISGYLTLLSMQKKSKKEFVKTKMRRLLIPWLFGVLVLIPLYKVIFLMSRGLPQESWTSYFHFSNDIISQSWLWYLPVLFIFDMIFLSLSKIKINPERISLKWLIPVIFIVGLLFSISMDIMGLQGWTKNAILNFQNERLLIYFMMFLLGALCFRKNIFQISFNKKTYAIAFVLALIAVTTYRYFYNLGRFSAGTIIFTAMIDKILFWMSFHFSLMSIMVLLLSVFRDFFNKEYSLSKILSANSYYVYILHIIVMGFIAFLLLEVNLPSVLKFFISTTLTYLLSNLLVSFHWSITGRFKLLFLK